MATEPKDKLERAQRMLKAAGTCTPEELAQAALICIEVACSTKNPAEWFEYIQSTKATGATHD